MVWGLRGFRVGVEEFRVRFIRNSSGDLEFGFLGLRM